MRVTGAAETAGGAPPITQDTIRQAWEDLVEELPGDGYTGAKDIKGKDVPDVFMDPDGFTYLIRFYVPEPDVSPNEKAFHGMQKLMSLVRTL